MHNAESSRPQEFMGDWADPENENLDKLQGENAELASKSKEELIKIISSQRETIHGLERKLPRKIMMSAGGVGGEMIEVELQPGEKTPLPDDF